MKKRCAFNEVLRDEFMRELKTSILCPERAQLCSGIQSMWQP
jgi:hypothetical protein